MHYTPLLRVFQLERETPYERKSALDGIRTHSLLVTSQLLYHWSYSSIEIEALLLFFFNFCFTIKTTINTFIFIC